jgi:hypothetical protein
MVVFSRKSQTWCLAAYFAAFMAFAQGAHFHPSAGFHFSHGQPCSRDSSDCESCHSGNDHGHSHAPEVAASGGNLDHESSTTETPGSGHSSHDDCPVCQFFAQGQLVSLPASAAVEFTASPERLWTPTLTWPIAVRLAYGARAPPALA